LHFISASFPAICSDPIMALQINTLFSLCFMIVRWKRAELRHRARLARESNKQDWSSPAWCSVRDIEEPLLPLRQLWG
jgi:hypothetical protein